MDMLDTRVINVPTKTQQNFIYYATENKKLKRENFLFLEFSINIIKLIDIMDSYPQLRRTTE